MREASARVHDRDAAVARCCEEMETDLLLLGASAIEDRLQQGYPPRALQRVLGIPRGRPEQFYAHFRRGQRAGTPAASTLPSSFSSRVSL